MLVWYYGCLLDVGVFDLVNCLLDVLLVVVGYFGCYLDGCLIDLGCS